MRHNTGLLGIHARRHAAAYCCIDLMAPDKSAAFRERGTDPLSADEGRLDTRSRQHYREFLTAHAAEYVVRSKCGGCDLAECSDHGVADSMAACVKS